MRKIIVILGCVVSLVIVNLAIMKKEKLLTEGSLVYLELAPIDPRSLMQGDYMALRFRIADEIVKLLPRNESSKLTATDGRMVAVIDQRSLAAFRRLDNGQPPKDDEIYLQYRVRAGSLKFATNAFFFQEGKAQDYQQARYGEFRVAPDGELLLTGLVDQDMKVLGKSQ